MAPLEPLKAALVFITGAGLGTIVLAISVLLDPPLSPTEILQIQEAVNPTDPGSVRVLKFYDIRMTLLWLVFTIFMLGALLWTGK